MSFATSVSSDEVERRTSIYQSVSDEVSTVGIILSWLYLASKLLKGVSVWPNGR